MMQTTFFAGQRPIDGVATARGSNLGYNNVPILDVSLRTEGVYDAASQGSAFRMPARSFTNIGPNSTSINRFTRYTANFYSDYRFAEGRLRNLRFGYGMQFRGPQVIGYRGADTIANPANPAQAIDDPSVDAYSVVWQKRYFLGTATLGYPVRVFRRKVELNFSITNLFNYNRPIYNSTGLRAASGDLSSISRVTYPRTYSYVVPRSFRFSATHQF
jgi:hypothetical protein